MVSIFGVLLFPVTYNKQVEGVLLANIPLSTINASEIDIEVLDGLMIEITKGTDTIATFGKNVVGAKQVKPWKDVQVSFNYTLDEGYRNNAIATLVIQLGSYALLAIILTTLLAYLYGYRYFVKPFHALSQLTSSLEKGEHHKMLPDELKFKEFANLFKQFNHMSEKVAMRELALKQSYAKLSAANDELKQSESQLVQSEKNGEHWRSGCRCST